MKRNLIAIVILLVFSVAVVSAFGQQEGKGGVRRQVDKWQRGKKVEGAGIKDVDKSPQARAAHPAKGRQPRKAGHRRMQRSGPMQAGRWGQRSGRGGVGSRHRWMQGKEWGRRQGRHSLKSMHRGRGWGRRPRGCCGAGLSRRRMHRGRGGGSRSCGFRNRRGFWW